MAVVLPVALVAAAAWSQSAARPPKAGKFSGPMDVSGPATFRSNVAVDGGVSAASVQAGSVDAGTLNVTGAASFAQRPTGVVLSGSLVKAAATGVTAGCNVFGTISVPGALTGDGCLPSAIPTSALTLGITYDCYVTAPATVTMRSCGLVSLVSAPAGTYQVRVIGP
jgi:hypothetical protein